MSGVLVAAGASHRCRGCWRPRILRPPRSGVSPEHTRHRRETRQCGRRYSPLSAPMLICSPRRAHESCSPWAQRMAQRIPGTRSKVTRTGGGRSKRTRAARVRDLPGPYPTGIRAVIFPRPACCRGTIWPTWVESRRGRRLPNPGTGALAAYPQTVSCKSRSRSLPAERPLPIPDRSRTRGTRCRSRPSSTSPPWPPRWAQPAGRGSEPGRYRPG